MITILASAIVDVVAFRRGWNRIKPIPRSTTNKCSEHNPKIGPLTDLHTRWHSSYFSYKRSSYKKAYDKETVDPVEIFQLSQKQVLPVSADMIRQAPAERSDFVTCDGIHQARLVGGQREGAGTILQEEGRTHHAWWLPDERLTDTYITKHQTQVLDELYDDHLGVAKIKAMARSYVWWPGIDKAIEQESKRCTGFPLTLNNPKITPLHSWEWLARPWQRIYVDFAGPFLGTMFLVVVDAPSKWPEAIPMTTTNTTTIIEEPRKLFTAHGLPEQLVSDYNSSQMNSEHSWRVMVSTT